MNDESYLVTVRAQIQGEEHQLGLIQQVKERELKELNKLREEKRQIKASMEEFTKREVDSSLQTIKIFHLKVEGEKEKREQELLKFELEKREIEEKSIILVETESRIIVELQEIKLQAMSLSRRIKEASAKLIRLAKLEESVDFQEGKGKEYKQRAYKLLLEMEEKMEEMMTAQEEKSKLLLEQEETLKRKGIIVSQRERWLGQMEEWVRVQEVKIASQWEDILSTKKILDGQRSKRQ